MVGTIRMRGEKAIFRVFGGERELEVLGGEASPGSVVRCRPAGQGVEVVETLAAPASVKARLFEKAAALDLRIAFPENVLTLAESFDDAGTDDEKLRDLSALPFVTIDYESSRDLDQAVYIEGRDDSFVVYYALADAAHFTGPGDAMFDEAMVRGTSFYLPDLMIPMLPHTLSEGLVSLNEDQPRRAFTFRIELDGQGRVTKSEFFQAHVRSRAKLTYDGVQAFLDGDGRYAAEPFAESLELLRKVGRLRMKLSDARDVVRFDRVATRMTVSEDGQKLSILASPRNLVQKYNEQISLLCNIEGAKALIAGTQQGLFRVHEPPTDERLAGFRREIDAFVKSRGLSDLWRWKRGSESLADYVERLPDGAEELRLSRAIQRQAMVLASPSVFALEPGPHYGIGAAAYSRFSAPMREIVGILSMHLLLGRRVSRTQLERAVEVANRAKSIQRKLEKSASAMALDQLFQGDLEHKRDDRPERVGTVMGVTGGKVYLSLDSPPVELKLYVRDLAHDYGELVVAENGCELVGKDGADTPFRLAAAVRVRVERYEKSRRRWLFSASAG